MKKKILCVAFLVGLVSCSSLFAKGNTGFGAQFTWAARQINNAGGALTFKVSSLPCVFAVDLGLSTGYTYLGVNADWWIQNPKIIDTWGFFYGVGVGGGLEFWNRGLGGCVGPRAVIGTNVFVINGFLEFYLQAAWHPLICFGASSNGAGVGFDWFNIPVSLGFRFWF